MPKKLHIGYFADGKWGHNAFYKLKSDDSIIIDFVCVRNNNRDPVLVKLAEEIPDAPKYKGVPGQVLVKTKDYILVKTKDSYIKITDYEGNVKVGDRFTTNGVFTLITK